MMLKEYMDFSGGKNTNLSPQNTLETMVADCLNVYWNGELKPRRGYGDVYDYGSGAVNGHIELTLESLGVTIIAVNISNVTHFYSNYSGSMAEIDATYTWAGANVAVQMAVLNEQIVIVDKSGTAGNAVGVIYYSSGMVIESLDDYDIRTVDTAFWFAGQYDSSETDGAAYIDYTSEAQSVAVDDFPLATTTANDGFWIGANQKFSKFTLTNGQQFSAAVAVWTYWNGTAWSSLTVAGITWTGAEANRVGTFTIPSDWAVFQEYDGVDTSGDTSAGSLMGNYLIRCSFTTAPAAASYCDLITVQNAGAVTLALGGKIPTKVGVHSSRIRLATQNAVAFSDYGEVKGWELWKTEYFADGGDQVEALVSMSTFLSVIKEDAIFGWYGTDPENFTLKKLSTIGTDNGDSCAVVNGILLFERFGTIYAYAGSGDPVNVSKHIDVTTGGWGIAYAGMYWYIYTGGILVTDPDLIQKDDNGDGIASWWIFDIAAASGYPMVYTYANQFSDANIRNRLVVAQGSKLRCLDHGSDYFDDTSTAIDCYIQTIPYFLNNMGQKKTLKRVKTFMNAAGAWTLSIIGENATVSVTIASGAGGTRYIEESSVPYTVDSESYAFKLENDTVNEAKIEGFTCEIEKRRF